MEIFEHVVDDVEAIQILDHNVSPLLWSLLSWKIFDNGRPIEITFTCTCSHENSRSKSDGRLAIERKHLTRVSWL